MPELHGEHHIAPVRARDGLPARLLSQVSLACNHRVCGPVCGPVCEHRDHHSTVRNQLSQGDLNLFERISSTDDQTKMEASVRAAATLTRELGRGGLTAAGTFA